MGVGQPMIPATLLAGYQVKRSSKASQWLWARQAKTMKTNVVAVSRALARSSCGSSCWSCWPTSRASSSYLGPATAGSSSSRILMRWQEKNLILIRRIVKDICQSTIVCCTCCVDTSAEEITIFPSCRAQPVCFQQFCCKFFQTSLKCAFTTLVRIILRAESPICKIVPDRTQF